jgi:acyl-CoA thioester hydrolase
MFRGASDYLACVLEVMLSHVDMKIHRTSPFPPHILANIEAMAARHKGLAVPPQVGHRIGLPPPR